MSFPHSRFRPTCLPVALPDSRGEVGLSSGIAPRDQIHPYLLHLHLVCMVDNMPYDEARLVRVQMFEHLAELASAQDLAHHPLVCR
jgi:hypothetical protein